MVKYKLLGIILVVSLSTQVNSSDSIAVQIDGLRYNFSQSPKIVDGEAFGATVHYDEHMKEVITSTGGTQDNRYEAIVEFPVDRFPEPAAHIKVAIAAGKPSVCTIDRDGEDENQKKETADFLTQWPMVICEEGREGADVAYVKSSDNYEVGAWLREKLKPYSDGTRVYFVLPDETNVRLGPGAVEIIEGGPHLVKIPVKEK
ncbi:hypothetical protein [Paenibacillus sp.]|uniref:hypothetical protein n=1 Tax=Paenibacillus sp. TaxID=58172 RepID=UPI002811A0A8|nr:hypothetical protein [Paenibacillus sp.]